MDIEDLLLKIMPDMEKRLPGYGLAFEYHADRTATFWLKHPAGRVIRTHVHSPGVIALNGADKAAGFFQEWMAIRQWPPIAVHQDS
ncbi:hypothetical protein [Pseudomonas typographi]|uniref:Uncharacterized protein n=1 Tax=Pseudomonas typographi TaxID=2715964 RepID=A0ABR7ZAF0_9PSED|nr:hypothetical protein [Pseudomonas typographi]MBD1602387.1 hypothetical protein [Pseudomonas typographi]